MLRRLLIGSAMVLLGCLFVALLALILTSVSPIYRFQQPRPFQGPDIFNPYQHGDTLFRWKRANFHTHTRVEGIFNECEYTPAQTDSVYRQLGYDIVTFSNHNALTPHPYDEALQVPLYEHGYNLFKYHKLVFFAERVWRFDHLVPLFASQFQFQMNRLAEQSAFVQLNHPLRTQGVTKRLMERLEGYRLIELDSGRSTENAYWDWALSAGHYSFALANDDLHYPDRSRCIAVRCNFLHTTHDTPPLRFCIRI